MTAWTENLERDASLVFAGAIGGFAAVCSVAVQLEDFAGGPDTVLDHANWLKAPGNEAYAERVSQRATELLIEHSHGQR